MHEKRSEANVSWICTNFHGTVNTGAEHGKFECNLNSVMEDVYRCDCVEPHDGASKCTGRYKSTEESKHDNRAKCQQVVESAKRQQANDKSQIVSRKSEHFYEDFYPFSM